MKERMDSKLQTGKLDIQDGIKNKLKYINQDSIIRKQKVNDKFSNLNQKFDNIKEEIDPVKCDVHQNIQEYNINIITILLTSLIRFNSGESDINTVKEDNT